MIIKQNKELYLNKVTDQTNETQMGIIYGDLITDDWNYTPNLY